jgi:hypothetical protein
MKRFQRFVREEKCECPEGWGVFAAFEKWCICIEDDPVDLDGDSDDESDDGLDESVIPIGPPTKSVEFPLLQFEDSIRIRLTSEGMFLRIGDGNFFPVPEAERQAIWKVIEGRLHG